MVLFSKYSSGQFLYHPSFITKPGSGRYTGSQPTIPEIILTFVVSLKLTLVWLLCVAVSVFFYILFLAILLEQDHSLSTYTRRLSPATMSTKKETERSKLVQEKCQNLITVKILVFPPFPDLLADPPLPSPIPGDAQGRGQQILRGLRCKG